ncbi:MAG TPA: serine/threonine-protein kinase, partial [Thermoanaerobaculia bacterium]|nr:serine/threonine-protein kinase [Thermoanaerobaculia bacterium]
MTTPAADPDQTARVSSDVHSDQTARVSSDVHYRPRSGADELFAPGTFVAGRYRVSGILGSGGMGEVYRAEDTKLGQLVALKFLPARLARDPLLLGHMHEEVRLGRQIAHPNVCRIYDIGEHDGAHFVAMEYVDGEDLSRLFRRIGRLPHDKAVDIARGMAAGLAAAHAKGILHRDLKPANVMIDAHGDARIMDFGLALSQDESDGTISGTPAYMAPEQLEGQPATVQSDLYALGLVMYELFTGKRAFNARSLMERARDISGEIATPSSLIRDIDPAVERIILRCLSNDPLQRPRSGREVINALPGGDPLQAALAAGETPSPSIVAAAGTAGSLRPMAGWSLLAAIVICMAVGQYYRRTHSFLALAPLQKHPEVLSDQASGILRTLGIPAQPFTSRTFEENRPYHGWIYTTDQSPARWERLRRGPPPTLFLYEEASAPRIDRTVALAPGSAEVALDRLGRLVELKAIPRSDWKGRPLDWTPLFTAAGLDPGKFAPAVPQRVPSAASDARAAWSGRHPEDGTPLRIEAAAWGGTPVFFRVGGPWDSATGEEVPFGNRNLIAFGSAMILSAIAVGLVLAWRNARARRGDRQGAARAAAAVFVFHFASRLLGANHQPSGLHEVETLSTCAAFALMWAAVVYVLYLALEPFVRRRWPDLLIGSTRLLSGNVRDPMIGRDVLIGILGGVAHMAIIYTDAMIRQAINVTSQPPYGGDVTRLSAPRHVISHLTNAVSSGIFVGFMVVIILTAFMLLFRRRALAVAGLMAVMVTGFYFATGGFPPGPLVITVLLATIASRFGMLAMAVAHASFLALFHSPQYAGGSWFTLTGMISLALVLGVAVWAFRTSLGDRSPFSASLLDA